MIFSITQVPDSEYAKADQDWNYSPREEVIDKINCEEWEIEEKIAAGKKSGKYPKNAQYTI